ncbi:MAG: DUF2007 domain-containing protein [Elusimicrobia bacterium]|nr:DUF2007 domain-containing protein [Elusimicrobiota bacterium]
MEKKDKTNQMKRSVVFTTANVMEADLIKGLLESNGLEVFLYDSNISRMYPLSTQIFGAIKLAVPESQKEKAEDVLSEYLAKDGKNPNSGCLTPFDSCKPDDENKK